MNRPTAVRLPAEQERGATAARSSARARPVTTLLAELPDSLVVILLTMSVVASVGLVLRMHHPLVVLASGLTLGPVLAWLVRSRRPYHRRDATASVAALVVAFALLVPNLLYPGEHLLVSRDPGFYTVTAQWLTEHSSPFVDSGISLLGSEDSLRTQASGLYVVDDASGWWPQGSHLVPALVSIPGLLGDRWLITGNAWLSAVSLIALYGLTRRVTNAWWALLPMVAFGLSLPWLSVSRTIYSEPITVAFGVGALTFLGRAWRERSTGALVLAGALAGAPNLARIDGALSMVVLLPVVGLAAGFAGRQGAGGRRDVVLFSMAGASTVGLGLLELRRNASPYLSDLASEATLVVGLLVVALVLALVFAWLGEHERIRRIARVASYRGAAAGAVVVLLVGAALAARPLFWTSHSLARLPPNYQGLVEGLQRHEGLPIDRTRGYDEMTFSWIAWYLGWPTAVLGVVGLAVATWIALRRRDWLMFGLVALVGGVSIAYLNRISITPDQIWASRRMVPVILPGFAVTAALALAALHRRRTWRAIVAYAGALVVAIGPLAASGPLFTTPQFFGQFREVTSLCAQLPSDARLLIGDERLALVGSATIRSWCDVPTLGVDLARAHALSEAYAVAPERPLYVLVKDPTSVAWTEPARPFLHVVQTDWEERLSGPPREVNSTEDTLFLGVVQPDGRAVPIG